MFVAIDDFERVYRALVPVLNLAQDSINILGYGELAQVGIGDRNRGRRNRVGEFGFGCDLQVWVEFEGDFVAHYPGTKRRSHRLAIARCSLAQSCGSPSAASGLIVN